MQSVMRDAINANAIAVGITTAHTTTAGEVTLHVPKLKGFDIHDRNHRTLSPPRDFNHRALVEMYLAGVFTRRVEDISEMLWGNRVSAATLSNLKSKFMGTLKSGEIVR